MQFIVNMRSIVNLPRAKPICFLRLSLVQSAGMSLELQTSCTTRVNYIYLVPVSLQASRWLSRDASYIGSLFMFQPADLRVHLPSDGGEQSTERAWAPVGGPDPKLWEERR